MEPQQLATKVAQLESRVATLEDEGKIVKGEVKQILTEIRSVILVRDNPFENEGAGMGRSQPVTVVAQAPQEAPPPRPEPMRQQEREAVREPEPPVRQPEPAREPIPLRPHAVAPPPEPEQPQWSLLTIAGLSAWAEEAMRRLGPLRLEILLDLCEAAGHLTTEARAALERVTELDIAEPAQTPTTNETVVILRQLDALVNDDEEYGDQRLQRRF
ncbi:MAG TPA: hypothetical protein VEZ14_11065 [Dehalococcoidia bacterium]|nr:hypothetical protein [Dehalococcoidia bacterium]